jgi:hypothetical protein
VERNAVVNVEAIYPSERKRRPPEIRRAARQIATGYGQEPEEF